MEIRVVEKKRKFKCLFHLQGAFHFATWRCDNVVNFAREGPLEEFVDEDYFISKNHRKDTRIKSGSGNYTDTRRSQREKSP